MLSWRDLYVIIKHSPHASAFRRAVRGEAADYGTTEYLLVAMLNGIRTLSYQMDGRKKKPDLEFFYPPGVADPKKIARADVMSIEEMNQHLGWA